MKKVLVTHPGRQHSHQAALALLRAGRLDGYWSGAPSLESHGRLLPRSLWQKLIRYAPVDLPAERVRWAPWTPALRRFSEAVLPPRLASRVDFLACRLFDHWAAARLPGVDCAAVVACEISALDTFRAARRLGRMTVLDAPSFHHAAQDRLHGFTEPKAVHARIVAVKEAEIALADHILTVSELARSTYLDAGLPPSRVHAVALGADTSLFRATEASPSAAGPFRFLFTGARLHRKAFDVLVEAFAEVRRREPEVLLRIVGPPGDSAQLAERLPPESISVSGPVPQAELAREFSIAHCLVLPSRNDSFGMVVAEALACGCPVIVSDYVGAKDLVTPGVNGWIVPAGDVPALAERMLSSVRDRAALLAMRPACRRSAESTTWEAYSGRLARLFDGLLGDGRDDSEVSAT